MTAKEAIGSQEGEQKIDFSFALNFARQGKKMAGCNMYNKKVGEQVTSAH